MRNVVLTDSEGNDLGIAPLLEAHTGEGKLHRAFSVYLFRSARTEILIQQRSAEKMLWGGIWANTCCSHPFPGEATVAAGERRLKEECGIEANLDPKSTFVYRADDPARRGVEYEHVTVLTSDVPDDTEPLPDPREVENIRWIGVSELLEDMKNNPDIYAPWFHIGLQSILHPEAPCHHPAIRK